MSKPLKDVAEPADLRDKILSEWSAFRSFRGEALVPAELRATSWAGDGNTSPSHTRGRAIDVVTSDWPDRRFLVEFAIWLAVREPTWNVITYGYKFQPHLHISDAGFGGGGSASSIAVNGGDAKSFIVWKREQWADKSADIVKALKHVSESYPKGPETDWSFWEAVLKGEESLAMAGGPVSWLKSHWYWIALPLGLAVVVWLIMRWRRNS